MSVTRYRITWRPVEVRLVVAPTMLVLTLFACASSVPETGFLGAGVILGCLVPSVRDTRRDLVRARATPSVAWLGVVLVSMTLIAVMSQLPILGEDTQSVRSLAAMAIVFVMTVMLMPVEVPTVKQVARREDGVALKCTKCGYDMEGVPGAVCPECGQDCGAAGRSSAERDCGT